MICRILRGGCSALSSRNNREKQLDANPCGYILHAFKVAAALLGFNFQFAWVTNSPSNS